MEVLGWDFFLESGPWACKIQPPENQAVQYFYVNEQF
jgi:hypothetical protein